MIYNKGRVVEKLTITTVNGEEYIFTENQADELFKAYQGAVKNKAPWIYTNKEDYATILQIQHIVSVHIKYGGESHDN